MTTLELLDHLGVFVFAMSGALMASKKEMDIFGFVVLALLPAVGGGTLRDLILGVPVFWLVDTNYLSITLAAAIATFIGYRFIHKIENKLVWFDAVGMAVFCVIGAAKAYSVTEAAGVAVFMGVVTAVAGGIMRDVVANESPLILHKEIYATAAFCGAVAFVVLSQLHVPGAEWIGILIALCARGAGIIKGWELPRATHSDDD